jgi:poly(3-hydroxybutyrate) depolymerase
VARALLFGALLLACASTAPSREPQPEPERDSAVVPPPDAARPADTAPPAPDAAAATEVAGAPDAAAAEAPPPAATGSPGCQSGAGLPDGQAAIDVGGTSRTYILRLPAGYTNQRAWPLVLALHPNGGAGIGYWDATSGARSIRTLAKDSAIVVLPLARPMGGGFDWRGDLPADLAYFDALIKRLESQLCIDTKRIFSMGFSGGGSFSGVLACRRSDIRAFASGSGVSYFDPKDCVGTAAAWITVGADPDEMIPARAQFRDYFVQRAGCQSTTTPTAPATCQAYACPGETPVHYCVHPGGHLWPDYGTQAAWTFFRQF